MNDALKRTSLYESHLLAGAKMVDFHGFSLPIWYSSIQEEHLATRSSAGIFDVSHMGFFRFTGKEVLKWLSSVSTQNFEKFSPGRCGYAHFLDTNGHIIDDMIFAVSRQDEVLGVPNSTMVATMYGWLHSHLPEDNSIEIEDLSGETSIIALQGPESSSVLIETLGEDNAVGKFKSREILENDLQITGWIQGTGYTGESGVEIFVPNEQAPMLWDSLCSKNAVTPVGLGARDTLRLEKGFLLSGQDFLWPELGASVNLPANFLARTSLETSVPYGLDLSHNFIGKEALVESDKSPFRWRGMLCLDRGPSPRLGHAVYDGPDEGANLVGHITSGGPSPSLEMSGIAMGYLTQSEGEVWIQSSKKRRVRSVIKEPPFI